MAGTKEGAAKARAKALAKDPNHYANIGRIGGNAPHTMPIGFASEKIGADGLTGRERTKLLGQKRKKTAKENQNE